ncbi:hypothetical protein DFJ74DRAFT_688562 [Hyaloraphidium curvatum]|nr:hypothetical protein DFJ74DRAFT_688562 [Hyaloraphidium curvatum]
MDLPRTCTVATARRGFRPARSAALGTALLLLASGLLADGASTAQGALPKKGTTTTAPPKPIRTATTSVAVARAASFAAADVPTGSGDMLFQVTYDSASCPTSGSECDVHRFRLSASNRLAEDPSCPFEISTWTQENCTAWDPVKRVPAPDGFLFSRGSASDWWWSELANTGQMMWCSPGATVIPVSGDGFLGWFPTTTVPSAFRTRGCSYSGLIAAISPSPSPDHRSVHEGPRRLLRRGAYWMSFDEQLDSCFDHSLRGFRSPVLPKSVLIPVPSVQYTQAEWANSGCLGISGPVCTNQLGTSKSLLFCGPLDNSPLLVGTTPATGQTTATVPPAPAPSTTKAPISTSTASASATSSASRTATTSVTASKSATNTKSRTLSRTKTTKSATRTASRSNTLTKSASRTLTSTTLPPPPSSTTVAPPPSSTTSASQTPAQLTSSSVTRSATLPPPSSTSTPSSTTREPSTTVPVPSSTTALPSTTNGPSSTTALPAATSSATRSGTATASPTPSSTSASRTATATPSSTSVSQTATASRTPRTSSITATTSSASGTSSATQTRTSTAAGGPPARLSWGQTASSDRSLSGEVTIYNLGAVPLSGYSVSFTVDPAWELQSHWVYNCGSFTGPTPANGGKATCVLNSGSWNGDVPVGGNTRPMGLYIQKFVASPGVQLYLRNAAYDWKVTINGVEYAVEMTDPLDPGTPTSGAPSPTTPTAPLPSGPASLRWGQQSATATSLNGEMTLYNTGMSVISGYSISFTVDPGWDLQASWVYNCGSFSGPTAANGRIATCVLSSGAWNGNVPIGGNTKPFGMYIQRIGAGTGSTSYLREAAYNWTITLSGVTYSIGITDPSDPTPVADSPALFAIPAAETATRSRTTTATRRQKPSTTRTTSHTKTRVFRTLKPRMEADAEASWSPNPGLRDLASSPWGR